MLFRGLCAFPLTPADEDGVVDEATLRGLVRRLVASGVDSIGLLGSTGTAPYLDRTQRRRAVECAVDQASGRVPIMVGIGALRTRDVISLGQDALSCGADAVLLTPVSYIPLSEAEVLAHFGAVAGAIDLPLCVYNNPGTTGFTFTPALIGRLSRIDQVVALKTPASDFAGSPAPLVQLRDLVAPGFSIGASVDARGLEALLNGADAWYSVLAGVLPELCVPIANALRAGDIENAKALNMALQPIWDAFAAHSSLRVTYAIATLLGYCQAVPPRPILPLDREHAHGISASLAALGVAH